MLHTTSVESLDNFHRISLASIEFTRADNNIGIRELFENETTIRIILVHSFRDN
jgi:hypothetical protein